ncbi:MAG TPA: UDP-N-acetylglucosamine 1-carboxyvinyltransferase [Mollicutes bacterium]|jgi:UDP-N-acetylglucosamine 1-carboxyvinyltransferase|nr:UDP-N-acetylglucosamine 1-carboxyvinyltransferase [Mollicutes bacterium]
MQRLEIEGKHILEGEVRISGAKNSAVALIPASVLSDGIVTISNVPNITDRDALNEILEYLNADVKIEDETMVIDSTNIENKEIPESISKKLRASYYFMGALLGKYKKVNMYFPGGCKIGARPINLHLKGFEALGAIVTERENQYIIEADELIGNNIYLDIASVGATINIMLAAVKAKGTTIIENAAKEPEVVNVAMFLNNMGARIIGAGTSEIKIIGVSKLEGCSHEVIPDRIEAGTYMIAASLMGNNVKISNVIPEHLDALLLKLKEIGIKIEVGNDYFIISKSDNMKSVNIKTLPYPGFPTDLQQPITTLLTQCEGSSKVEETIYENRFLNVDYLNKMGSNIKTKDKEAIVYGVTPLKGCEVIATDLRAGACLVLAALIAEGKTTIHNIDHILRGYEGIVEKLNGLGAKIKIV